MMWDPLNTNVNIYLRGGAVLFFAAEYWRRHQDWNISANAAVVTTWIPEMIVFWYENTDILGHPCVVAGDV